MNNSIWSRFSNSVCTIDFFNKRGVRFYRLTGFSYDDFIISASCRREIRRSGYVTISFGFSNGSKDQSVTRLSVDQFEKSCFQGQLAGLPGLIFIKVSSGEMNRMQPVSCSGIPAPETGSWVAIITSVPDRGQLCIKTGFISAIIVIKGRNFMLVDSSVEQSSRGAPMFDLATGGFTGVLTGSMSRGAEKYKKLKQIISHNIRLLNDSTGKWTVGNIDPAQVLAANQYMIKYLARDLYLSGGRDTLLALPAEDISRLVKGMKMNGLYAGQKYFTCQ